MRTSAALLFLVASACASSPTAVIDQRVLKCGPGAAISLQAGLNGSGARLEQADDQLTLVVEVSNDSDDEVTVKDIRFEQTSTENARYVLSPERRAFNRAVAEGDEELFEIPVTGRARRNAFSDPSRGSGEVEIAVVTTLTNGDSYRCYFSVRPPLSTF